MDNEQIKQLAHRYPILIEWSEEKGGWVGYTLGLGIAIDIGVEEDSIDEESDLPIVDLTDACTIAPSKIRDLLMTGSPLPEPVVIPDEYKR